MNKIVIMEATFNLLWAHSGTDGILEHKDLPDGRIEIEVDSEVLERLRKLDSDPEKAIRMLCTKQMGHA